MKEYAKGLGDIFLPTWKQAITDFTLRDQKCTAAVFQWAAGPGPPPPSSVLGTSACAFVSESSQPGHGLPCYLLQSQPSESPPTLPALGTTCSWKSGLSNFPPLLCSSWDQGPAHSHCTRSGQRTGFLANRSLPGPWVRGTRHSLECCV